MPSCWLGSNGSIILTAGIWRAMALKKIGRFGGKKWLVLNLLSMLALLTGCAFSQDMSDKSALRRQCRVPACAKLVEYKGYPAMVGFGQREGLRLEGRFSLSGCYIASFEKDSRLDGWRELPIPPEILEKVKFQFSVVDMKCKSGLYRCVTAGDDILHAKKSKPVSEVETPIDVIVSVYDREKREICAAVASGY